ncbi:MAG TPA: hypothetical protein VGI70_18220 [Polyangiales bacterium]|jgi:hypothetical protein
MAADGSEAEMSKSEQRSPPSPSPSNAPTPAKSGAAFVRTLPDDMPSAEVVRRAKAAGFPITIHTVHNVRHEQRKRAPIARSRSTKLGARIPKRQFVEEHPIDMPVKELLALAHAAGHVGLSRKQVHMYRHKMRKERSLAAKYPIAKEIARSAARSSSAVTTPIASEAGTAANDKRALFRALILEIGMDAAQEEWDRFDSIRRNIKR